MSRLTYKITACALAAASMWLGSQDGNTTQERMAQGKVEPSPMFQWRTSRDIGGVSADITVTGSPLVYDGEGKPVRVLSAVTICHKGQVILQQSHQMGLVEATSSESLRVYVGPQSLGVAQNLAAEVLGLEAPNTEAPTDLTEEVFISVSPAAGLVWGGVTNPSEELTVDVTPPGF